MNNEEVQEELKRLYRCIWYDVQDGQNREDMFVKEVGLVMEKHGKQSEQRGRTLLLNEQAQQRREKLNATEEGVIVS